MSSLTGAIVVSRKRKGEKNVMSAARAKTDRQNRKAEIRMRSRQGRVEAETRQSCEDRHEAEAEPRLSQG